MKIKDRIIIGLLNTFAVNYNYYELSIPTGAFDSKWNPIFKASTCYRKGFKSNTWSIIDCLSERIRGANNLNEDINYITKNLFYALVAFTTIYKTLSVINNYLSSKNNKQLLFLKDDTRTKNKTNFRENKINSQQYQKLAKESASYK